MNNIAKIAEYYKALSEPTRLRIIKLLMHHKYLCVNAITNKLNVTQSAVSQHLRVLRQMELVNSERMSNQIHYSLNKDKIRKFQDMITKELGKELS